MESVRKRLKTWKGRIQVLFSEIVKIIKGKKWILQLTSIVLLLILSLIIYMKVSSRGGYQTAKSYRTQNLNEAINQYRLGNYLRAEMIFNSVAQESKNENDASIAAIYLGNIMVKRNQFEKAIEYYHEAWKNKITAKFAYYNSAVVEQKRGNINKAIRDAKAALKYDVQFVEANLLLGNLYYLKRDYNSAIKVYDKYQDNPVFLYNKAATYLMLGDVNSAETLFLTLVTRKDTEKVIKGLSYYELGNIYTKTSPKKSSFYYYQAFKIFNQNDDILYNSLIIMAKSGDFVGASKLIFDMDIGKTLSDDEKIALSYILFKSGRYKKALDLLLPLDGNNTDAYILLGEVSLQKGDFKSSELYYGKALKVAKGIKEKTAIYCRLISMYQELGMPGKAVSICSSIDDKDIKSNFAIKVACAKTYFQKEENDKALDLMLEASNMADNERSKLFKLASIYYKYGYDNNALMILYKIHNLYPDDYRSLLGISKIFTQNGQKERALEKLDIILERCKDLGIYYEALILKAENTEIDIAENIYKTLMKDFPYRYEAYYNLARLYLEEKRYKESSELIDRLIEGEIKIPDRERLYSFVIKGIATYELGRDNEAYNSLVKAINIEQDNELARVNLNILKSINK